jgi:HlyD family secretion protein
MSSVASPPQEPRDPVPAPRMQAPAESRRRGKTLTRLVLAGLAGVLLAGGAIWASIVAYSRLAQSSASETPTAVVRRGDVSLAITAPGELRGGNPDTLTAPMTGGSDMHLTVLRDTGEEVKSGEVVAEFDTKEQEFKLKEAEGDLAEAQQKVIQAKSKQEAEEEEDRYALSKAKADVRLGELDVRKNPILPAITAKQNDLALAAAQDHLAQLEKNLHNRTATNQANLAVQEAGVGKAEAQITEAKKNIDAMTLKAHRAGYVSIKPNTNTDFFFSGMTLPDFQVGDRVRPGMAVAEIPDMSSWEVVANVAELDRGHLAVGDKVSMKVIALPGKRFTGRVKDLGATAGMPWDRKFACHISLDDPAPELRPGMTTEVNVTTDELKGVLWLPSQALFESDGKTYVYLKVGSSFTTKDVTLVRRNEARVVITGVAEKQVVALANPAESSKKKPAAAGAAIPPSSR